MDTTGAPTPPVTALMTGRAARLDGVHATGDQDACHEQQPRLHATASGRRDRHQAAGGRPDERLYRVVGVIDRGYLVGHEFHHEKHGHERDEPPRAEQVEGLAQLDPAEPLGECHGQQRDVGVDAGGRGERDTGQDVHATSKRKRAG